MTTGACLCGEVRFEVDGPFEPLRLCHCPTCRRMTGSAFSANARVADENFRLVAGAEHIREWPHRLGGGYAFCGRCGSPLYATNPTRPGTRNLRLGLLDGDPGLRASAHVHVDLKAEWFEISSSLPQFGGSAPKPGDPSDPG